MSTALSNKATFFTGKLAGEHLIFYLSALYCDAVKPVSHLDFESAVVGVPEQQVGAWGFRAGEKGTHTSRTIMLEELFLLLDSVPRDAFREHYANAVVVENCLGKKTVSNRKISLQHLRELYALDPRVELFRALRELWRAHRSSGALLALLLSLARDPLLRTTATAVLSTPIGHEFARQPMTDAIAGATGDRLSRDTVDKVVRNASSSWTQSGHLRGRARKTRQQVQATPAAVTYALLIGFATGRRGGLLFETPWCRVLDNDFNQLIELAVAAKRLGLLDLKQSGSIIDVSFPGILAPRPGS